jgi:hypothetical protein
MEKWYEVKFVVSEMTDTGKIKDVKKTVFVQTDSYSEAENLVTHHFDGDSFEISSIKKPRLTSVELGHGDRFFNVKVGVIQHLDEGETQVTLYRYLVRSESLEESMNSVKRYLDIYSDWEFLSVVEAQVWDVITGNDAVLPHEVTIEAVVKPVEEKPKTTVRNVYSACSDGFSGTHATHTCRLFG